MIDIQATRTAPLSSVPAANWRWRRETMQIEFHHMRYTLAAAGHDSFRRAATAIGIQVSEISRAVRNLEDDIGATHVVRSNGAVSRTLAGKRFVGSLRKILCQIDHAITDAELAGRGEEGQRRVGIFSPLASGFLAKLFDRFNDRHPLLHLAFVEGLPGVYILKARRHEIDVAFDNGQGPIEDCDVEFLWSERVLVVSPCGHSLVECREICWADLNGCAFVVTASEPGPEFHDYLAGHLSHGNHPSTKQCAVPRNTLFHIVAMRRGLILKSKAGTGMISGSEYRPLVAVPIPFSALWVPGNASPVYATSSAWLVPPSKTELTQFLKNNFLRPLKGCQKVICHDVSEPVADPRHHPQRPVPHRHRYDGAIHRIAAFDA